MPQDPAHPSDGAATTTPFKLILPVTHLEHLTVVVRVLITDEGQRIITTFTNIIISDGSPTTPGNQARSSFDPVSMRIHASMRIHRTEAAFSSKICHLNIIKINACCVHAVQTMIIGHALLPHPSSH
jgi:hypothetical protein